LVAGRKRVPSPATGMTSFLILDMEIKDLFCKISPKAFGDPPRAEKVKVIFCDF